MKAKHRRRLPDSSSMLGMKQSSTDIMLGVREPFPLGNDERDGDGDGGHGMPVLLFLTRETGVKVQDFFIMRVYEYYYNGHL